MKSDNLGLFLGLLALACTGIVSSIEDCNPDGNGKPVCDGSNVGQRYRNFWDPTAYWLCIAAGAEPVLVRCPSNRLFDSATGKCISSSQWVWTPPCPEDQ